ncbi:MAG: hypothetical protein ABR616_10890 [Dermatophilaceae bacterium]|nr:hypothetical protein [Intrasporangiaceae bacterium]
MTTKIAHEVSIGDRFPSPRREEGVVRAVCGFAACQHGHEDRVDHVHVAGATGQWFIALIRDEEMHVCDDDCPSFLGEHTDEEIEAHLRSNYHQG